jgi:hypothetical protein
VAVGWIVSLQLSHLEKQDNRGYSQMGVLASTGLNGKHKAIWQPHGAQPLLEEQVDHGEHCFHTTKEVVTVAG